MIEYSFQDGLPFKGNKIWIFLCLDHRRKNALVLINPSKAYKPWVVLGNVCREVSRFKVPKEVWEGAAWESGDLGPTAYSTPGLLFDFRCVNSSAYLCLIFPHCKVGLWHYSPSKHSLIPREEKCYEASAKSCSPTWCIICKVLCCSQVLNSDWVSAPLGPATLLKGYMHLKIGHSMLLSQRTCSERKIICLFLREVYRDVLILAPQKDINYTLGWFFEWLKHVYHEHALKK